MKHGRGYLLSNPDVVAEVDRKWPHAIVDTKGDWTADPETTYLQPVTPKTASESVAVFSSDSRYYPGLVVALQSFKTHHPDIHTVILNAGLSIEQAKYLSQFSEVKGCTKMWPNDPVWARFDLSLLPYERIVYIDCDVVILKELEFLFDTKEEFVAVQNLDWRVTENFSDHSILDKYEIERDCPAFFSGTFSIDNEKWGSGKLLEEAVKVFEADGESFLYADQSGNVRKSVYGVWPMRLKRIIC